MVMQFQSVPNEGMQNGIDARSAENSIPPGFARDLLNADIVEQRARKRPGYQGSAGNLPIRITQMEYENAENMICFILPEGTTLETSGISLETTPSSPIVVYGRSSSIAAGGPFTTAGDSVKYYPGFTVPIRKSWTAPSGTMSFTAAEHGILTTNQFISVVESTSLTDRSYSYIIPDAIRIDTATFDIEVDYTTATDRNVFIFQKERDGSGGNSYIHSTGALATGTHSISIPTGTHNLSNYNIIVQVQEDIGGGEYAQVEVDSFSIATNGDVTVSITNGDASSHTYYIILSAAPVANLANGVVDALSTGTVVISGLTSPWIFYGIYLVTAGVRELVYPDSIEYDDTAATATLTFTNGNATARNYEVYYEYGILKSNKLCVDDSTISVDAVDTRPQITIWGLDHQEIYPTKTAREGWVSHIDSYRRSGEQRLVCSLGGNLYSARTFSEAASQYSYPQLYPKLNTRTSTNLIVGPLFWATGETPARTRGYITGTDGTENQFVCSEVEYDTGTGLTKYTIDIPSMLFFDSAGAALALNQTNLDTLISTTAGLEDYLTVNSMSYTRHNGTFRIADTTIGTNQIILWLDVPNGASDWDDIGTAGQCGIFTDQLPWTASAPYIPDDTLVSSAFGQAQLSTVVSSLGSISVADGLFTTIQIPSGVLFLGERTSNVVPLRNGYPTATSDTTDLVRGDMLSYTGVDRLIRVLSINPDTDRTVGITELFGLATVTLGSGNTDYLTSGMSVLLLQAGVYSGVQVISDVTSSTTFQFETEESGTVVGGILVGETAEIDEQLTWQDTPGDTNSFVVEERWIPIEAPDDSFDLTPTTYVQPFDANSYVQQAFLRSTMVVDNMYFTNGQDEVYKFDGTNSYRAGIIPWQPGAFLTQNTAATARIVTNLRSFVTMSGDASSGSMKISFADSNSIPVGQPVRLAGSTQTYTVRSYSDDGIDYYVQLDRALDATVTVIGAGSVSEIGTFRYYFRLNAVDANSNIIASAVTGYQDHVVELTGDSAVTVKLTGLPAWDIYDYDRLEVQIYRTKMNTFAPFYLVTTLPMSFDNTDGYVSFTDAFADSDLNQLDVVSTALKGTELGVSWSDPLRANYITSIGNRLVLGNVRDYPQLDIQIIGDATVSNTELAGDTLLFRRDNTDTGTTTNMPERVKYEWRNTSSAIAVTGITGSAGTSFTVTVANTAVAGDWAYLTYPTVATTGRPVKYSGWWQIASATGAAITINYTEADAGAITGPTLALFATDPTDVPVPLGTDGNMGMVNGDSFDVFDAMRRMSMAISASMRQVDVDITGMGEFTPWLIARSGNDTPPGGRLIVRQPRNDSTTMELVPTFSGYNIFVNSIQRSTGNQISASTRVFPSRILVSYENYPEIFDNPTAILDGDSDSAIDINSADGQEITGVIPFFGEAAFGAAQQSAILVVFKSNSIYLVDINQKLQGLNAVQRIETEGLGCTAPYSIAVTRGGIMFANESGIYCLRRNQSIEYIGKYMERNWTEQVDRDQLSVCQGHHYGIGRSYKLSVPILDADSTYTENSEVYTYNHTGEAEGRAGAWSRYDNHPATGWANLASDAYFASTTGRVFSIRRIGDVTDYRDDNEAINMVIESRPTNFGDSGIRKVVSGVVVDYRTGATNEGTALNYALDLEQEYSPTTEFRVVQATTSTGLSDPIGRDITSILHSVDRRKCIYFSIQLVNDAIDENIEISGITYKVAGLSDRGMLQAKQTTE